MNTNETTKPPQVGGSALNDELDDSGLLDFLDNHKQYIIGFAPSGDWSAFDAHRHTCYGSTLRECLKMLIVMHNDLTANAIDQVSEHSERPTGAEG